MVGNSLLLPDDIFVHADIPVSQCYSCLLSDISAESQVSAKWKPSLIAREACLEILKSKLHARNKKQRLKAPVLPMCSGKLLVPIPTPVPPDYLRASPELGTLSHTAPQVSRRVSALKQAVWGPAGEPGVGPTFAGVNRERRRL